MICLLNLKQGLKSFVRKKYTWKVNFRMVDGVFA